MAKIQNNEPDIGEHISFGMVLGVIMGIALGVLTRNIPLGIITFISVGCFAGFISSTTNKRAR